MHFTCSHVRCCTTAATVMMWEAEAGQVIEMDCFNENNGCDTDSLFDLLLSHHSKEGNKKR